VVDADFDGSGKVDFQDFLAFAGAFGSTETAFDLTSDGKVDFNDFLVFASFFGQNTTTPEPEPVDPDLILRQIAAGVQVSGSIVDNGTAANINLANALNTFKFTGSLTGILALSDVRAAPLAMVVMASGRVSFDVTREAAMESFAASGSSSFHALALRAAGTTQAFFDQIAASHSRYNDLHQNNLYKDLLTLTALYTHFGDTSAAESLIADWNISFFGRYKPSTLIHMLENTSRLSDAPLAAVAFSKRDSSGAYYQYATHVNALLGKGYDVRVFEADDEQDWADHIISVGQRYGQIDLLVIMGHGLPGLISLKPAVAQSDGIIRDFGTFRQWLDVDDQDLLQAIRPYFSDSPDIIINACETGYEDVSLPTSLARFLSEGLNARVFSPVDITYLQSITTSVEDGKLVVSDVAYGGQTAVYEPAGSNVDTSLPLDEQLSWEFVELEGGTFTMGSPFSEQQFGRSPLETERQITLSPFAISATDITQGDWFVAMNSKPWLDRPLTSSDPTKPAVYISWEAAQSFVQTLNAALEDSVYRLPTEAEWEYACRAGTSTPWASGNSESGLSDIAWYSTNDAKAAGTKDPNAWSVYDMHGNVAEWVSDWYGNYAFGSQTDPPGPLGGADRVVRGGGFEDQANDIRSAKRSNESPDAERYYIGFRVVKILE